MRKLDIYRSFRSDSCQEGPFPPSLVDDAPVLSIAEIVRNPDVLLQKQRHMMYDDESSEIYPDTSFDSDAQDYVEPFPAIHPTKSANAPLTEDDKKDKPLEHMQSATDTQIDKEPNSAE